MGISNANCVCGNGALEIGGFQILKKDFSLENIIFNYHPTIHLYFFKKCSHFLKKVFSTEKKVISQKKRLSQDEEKVFSEKKLFYFFENAHLKKKRNAFLWTINFVRHFLA